MATRKYKKNKKSRKKSRKKRRTYKNLSRWFAEEWVDVCTGKPCGRRKGSKRRMPYCRPKRRVGRGTPKTRRQLSKKKRREMCKKKRRRPNSRMKKV